ncbi:hypothetical protein [Winslowiella iniecta]|uniref:Lipoprotein n=1 Tax=Winslowiella iniecta TaxID=1560201 RepID=A0A0L7THK7_9GAMM|nr:hypothetical protein [Winslowiella iniecta]KOC89286.1 hypothetical protein NG42_13260 [Winslowiella iniecta]KOC94853.1 hypothetical protein NG43_03525 [Winslowiella iniecta]
MKKSVKLPALLLVCLALAGCQANKNSQNRDAVKAAEKLATTNNQRQQLELCHKQLEALKLMQAESYNALFSEFNRVMSGAASYANVRNDISALNQDTVDALYRYRVNSLCSRIDQALLTALSRQDDSLP